jgi:hypothetical protein
LPASAGPPSDQSCAVRGRPPSRRASSAKHHVHSAQAQMAGAVPTVAASYTRADQPLVLWKTYAAAGSCSKSSKRRWMLEPSRSMSAP